MLEACDFKSYEVHTRRVRTNAKFISEVSGLLTTALLYPIIP